jgi:hypothetical protein
LVLTVRRGADNNPVTEIPIGLSKSHRAGLKAEHVASQVSSPFEYVLLGSGATERTRGTNQFAQHPQRRLLGFFRRDVIA